MFLCGNASQIHDIVDSVSVEGAYVGACAAAWAAGGEEPAAPAREAEGAAAAASAEIYDALPAGAESLVCICCPKGCAMVVRSASDAAEAVDALSEREAKLHVADGWLVQGNQCKRGLGYAVEEKTNPQRTLTTLVRTSLHAEPLSVRTNRPIPKAAIPACLEALAQVQVDRPCEVGGVVVPNICNTGADVVATKALP